MHTKLYSDGYVNGHNPSPIGGGYRVCDETGRVLFHERIRKQNFTNNEAELLGVQRALLLSEPFSTVSTDSQNTIYWVRSGNPKSRPDLKSVSQYCKELVKLKHIKLIWEPREVNLAGIENEKVSISKGNY
jgi:ribonuclease HI